MANIWVSSDPHFGHANCLQFVTPDGTRMRPFSSVEEMDEFIIGRHNSVVRPQDHYYCLGDVAMHRHCVAIAKRLNGHKRLVLGNHDTHPIRFYLEAGFEKVYGSRLLDNMIFSHIPLHPESVKKRWLANIHGHVHNNVGPLHFGPRYFNVSLEVINYTPVALEDLKVMIQRQQEEWQWQQQEQATWTASPY